MSYQRSTQVFVRRTRLAVSADEAFRWHGRPGAIQRLTPPWERAEIVEHSGIHDGAAAVIKVYLGPIPALFVVRHSGYIAGRQFRDTQVEGPFARWEHTRRFEPDGERSCHNQRLRRGASPYRMVTVCPLSLVRLHQKQSKRR